MADAPTKPDENQLELSLVLKHIPTAPPFTVAEAKEAIVKNIPECAEMWGDPLYRPFECDWVYTLALTPAGPLLRMAAKLSRRAPL